MDLLAELAKEKAEFERKRSADPGNTQIKTSRLAKSGEKRSHWLDEHEAQKSASISAQEKNNLATKAKLRHALQENDELERSRRALQFKAAKYEQMHRKGTDMYLEPHEADNLMVDFDRKHYEGHGYAHESDRSPQSDRDDPWVEIEDEFGRTRSVRQSETLNQQSSVPSEPQNLIYGPHMQHFDVDSKRKDEIWEEVKQDTGETHYDPNWELRTKGTGYINLGSGQDRTERMHNLHDLRQETVDARDITPARAVRKQEHEERRAKILKARAKLERQKGELGS